MPSDRKSSLILLVAVAVAIAHVVLTGGIFYILIKVLSLGDRKFSGGGFDLYWPLWTVAFLPVVICAAVAWVRAPSFPLFLVFAAITYLAMLASFYFDAHWLALASEWVVLGMLFFRMTRRMSGNPRP